ncbi:MAG: hypothetical protein AB7H90_00580 [Alphaproteobacteria bacterium]
MDGLYLVSGDTAPDEYLTGGQPPKEPRIEPGQIWLVECEPAALSAFHAALLRHANVVLYERALGAALAECLPIGAYAEPLSATAIPGPVIAQRARHFAAEGWSVVQLVERRDGRERLPQVAAEYPRRPGGEASLGQRSPARGQIFTANGLAG